MQRDTEMCSSCDPRSPGAIAALAPASPTGASRRPAVFALALALAFSALALAPRQAAAHSGSIAWSYIEVGRDQREVRYRLKLSPPDAGEVLGLPEGADPPDDLVESGADKLIEYVRGHIAIQPGPAGEPGQSTCPTTGQSAGVIHDGGRFVEVTWTARCAAPIETLVVVYELFFDLDPRAQGLVVVTYGDETSTNLFRPGEARLVWELGAPPPVSLAAWVHSGVDHIACIMHPLFGYDHFEFGYDHVAFLLGLLLVIAIARGHDGSWERRGLRSGLRYTLGIVTSFTLAHSITLIASSLGWISLPTRPVEIVIAASIAYIAIENIMKPDVRWRYVLTFGFGLIHGLGFASVLSELLPPTDVVVPLLLFNVGVELGQLSIVVVVLPLLALAARALGAVRYRDWVVNIGSGLLAVSGLLWLVERLFEVTILGL